MRLDELEVFKVEVAPATRQRHLDMITTEIRRHPSRRSFRPMTLMLAAAVVLVPLAALASAPSLPGEFLHPVKVFLEPAWLLIDGDVRARHRVEELEILIERQGARTLIEQQLLDAEAAVGDRPLLRQRLEQARENLARGPVSDEMRPTTTTTTSTTTTPVTTTTVRPATVESTTQPPATTTTVATRESTRP